MKQPRAIVRMAMRMTNRNRLSPWVAVRQGILSPIIQDKTIA
jgi:hypothetical protein